MQLEILTPEKILFKGDVLSVHLPGNVSPFTVLRNHAPLMSLLDVGRIVWSNENGESGGVDISGGFVEVKNNRIVACVEPV